MSLHQTYTKHVVPALQNTLHISNVLALPRMQKVILNTGVGKHFREEKDIAYVADVLRRITGQKPILMKAKKSISNFKVRSGMVVGIVATLRGRRMYDFIEKFVHVTLPRVRDFRGISPTSVDQHGNCTIGLKEHIAFPEIASDEIERLHGLGVTIVTENTGSREKGLLLLKALGFPFITS